MSLITDFAIAECTRQEDLSYQSVGEMVEAWHYALVEHLSYKDSITNYLTPEFIKRIGKLVKSSNKGFRVTPVVFRNGDQGAPYTEIFRLLTNLCDAYALGQVNPDEFYFEFEKIHPFEDGNGRVGTILWNLLMGNYTTPTQPPNVFNNIPASSNMESLRLTKLHTGKKDTGK